MDNKVYNLLEEYGININLDEEEQILKRIQELNKENELRQVEYKTIISENRKEIEKQLDKAEGLRELINLDKLEDKEYLKQTIVRLGTLLAENKKIFIKLTDKALRELGGN